jgi:crotonobetainyl-CoA:carnitine CoA-transferase CaiB-like acyl-CoA transferase
MTSFDPAAPLKGITVIDLTRVMTGPYATMMLGDLGADVIKVELPGKGDDTRLWGPPFVQGEASYFLTVNRNKRSIAIDLKSEGGQAVLWELIERADVLVENFSPGTIDRLGFGWEAVHERNPALVFASISGFGQTGPSRSRTAYDLIVQGMSGMMSVTGEEGGMPTKLGIPIADIAAGMFAAYAIAGALYGRERDPEHLGQKVDTSMLGGQVALLTYQAGIYFTTGETPTMLGNRHPIITPYDTFATADGFVNIAVGNDPIWQRFCTALGLEAERDDPRFRTNADRCAHRDEVYAIVNAAFAPFTTTELVDLLDKAAVPCGPIHDVAEVMNDPQTHDQHLVRTVPHATLGEVMVNGMPYHFNGAAPDIRYGPPVLGQHSEEILLELGFDPADVTRLIQSGAVETPAGGS